MIVDFVDKVLDVRSGIEERFVFVQLDLFDLERLDERLRSSIVVRIALATHADGNVL